MSAGFCVPLASGVGPLSISAALRFLLLSLLIMGWCLAFALAFALALAGLLPLAFLGATAKGFACSDRLRRWTFTSRASSRHTHAHARTHPHKEK
jgi:hypothetical protein